jgi:O-antigen ligase
VDAASPVTGGTEPEAVSRSEGNFALAALAVAAIGAALGVVTYRSFDLDRFFVPKELALHLGALGMAMYVMSRRERRAWTAADVALAAWLGFSVISMFGATSGWLAMRALALTASAAIVYWSASTLRAAGRERAVVIILCLAISLAGLSALAQAYGFVLQSFATNRAPGGTLGNRNFVAHVSAMALPMILWLVATTRSNFRALIGSGAILVASAALVLSRTRAAWLALAIWLALLLPLTWSGRAVFRAAMPPGRTRLLAATLVTGVVLALVVPNALDWRSDTPYLDSVRDVVNYREGSGAGRLRQYQNSLKMTRAHPVAGVGPGNWAAEYPAFAGRGDPSIMDATGMTANPWPSSDWVAAISERGIPAALAIIGFVFLLLRNSWRGWSDSVYSSRERVGALAGGSVVLVGTIEGTFDAVTLLAFPSVVMWASAGALIPAARALFTSPPSTRAIPIRVLGVGLLWSALVAISAAKINAMRLYSRGTYDDVRMAASYDPGSYRIQLRAAETQAARGMCPAARVNAQNALSLFPHAQAPRQVLARCGGSEKP